MQFLKKVIFLFFLLIIIIWFYTNSLIGVNQITKNYLQNLKETLKEKGFQPNLFVISGRRWQLDNYLLNTFGGAAKKSQHLKGNAIDIIVLDINNDGKRNTKDVDIVYKLLNDKIINQKGGIGTYKNTNGFFNRQMIHFDCRGYAARWHR